MVADRAFRQGESGGDLGIGEAFHQIAEDLEFARGEACLIRSGRASWAAWHGQPMLGEVAPDGLGGGGRTHP